MLQPPCKVIDGWMTGELVFFSTVFQFYQDNGKVIMKGYVEWNLFYDWKDFCLKQGFNLEPLDQ